MTTKWRLSNTPEAIGEDGGDFICGLLGKSSVTLTETNAQLKFYTDFTCTDLRVNFTILDISCVVTLRDDAVNTSVSLAVSGTGWVEDLTDSVAVAADSLMALEGINGGSMHGDNMSMRTNMLTIEHASTNAPIMGSAGASSKSATFYPVMGASSTIETTQVRAETTFKRANTLSNFRIIITAGSSIDWDISPFRNSTASSSVTINITTTGVFEDVTGSETYADGDTASFGFVRTSGSMTQSVYQIDGSTEETWLSTRSMVGVTTRNYNTWHGGQEGNSADDNYFMRIDSVSIGNLEAYVSSAGTGTRDITLRVNSTDSTNVKINITTTGYLEDVTGTETVADGDSILMSLASTGSSITVPMCAIEFPITEPPVIGRRVMITSD